MLLPAAGGLAGTLSLPAGPGQSHAGVHRALPPQALEILQLTFVKKNAQNTPSWSIYAAKLQFYEFC